MIKAQLIQMTKVKLLKRKIKRTRIKRVCNKWMKTKNLLRYKLARKSKKQRKIRETVKMKQIYKSRWRRISKVICLEIKSIKRDSRNLSKIKRKPIFQLRHLMWVLRKMKSMQGRVENTIKKIDNKVRTKRIRSKIVIKRNQLQFKKKKRYKKNNLLKKARVWHLKSFIAENAHVHQSIAALQRKRILKNAKRG